MFEQYPYHYVLKSIIFHHYLSNSLSFIKRKNSGTSDKDEYICWINRRDEQKSEVIRDAVFPSLAVGGGGDLVPKSCQSSCNPMDCAHGFLCLWDFPGRILELIYISFSRRLFRSRISLSALQADSDWTMKGSPSCLANLSNLRTCKLNLIESSFPFFVSKLLSY